MPVRTIVNILCQIIVENIKPVENSNIVTIKFKQEIPFEALIAIKDTLVNLVLNKMKYPENVIIKKGYFPESVQGIEDKFCFVSIDADLYTPILNGLEYFYPRLEKGGYIFIHDFGGYSFEGAKQAVLEFCDKYNISYGESFISTSLCSKVNLKGCGDIIISSVNFDKISK